MEGYNIDAVALSIYIGIALVILYVLKKRQIPPIKSLLEILILAQSVTYGSLLIMYGLTSQAYFLIADTRWMLSFGGAALLWIGIDAFANIYLE